MVFRHLIDYVYMEFEKQGFTVIMTECKDGTYGLGCKEQCGNCSDNETCNKTDGGCAKCAAGYKGNTCVDSEYECLSLN